MDNAQTPPASGPNGSGSTPARETVAANRDPHAGGAAHHAGRAALTLAALGVVFGDIGTSPLYAVQTVFTADNHAVKTSAGEVYGVISLIFWAITIIVSIKYVTFIMRADNGGEGGIMALTALLQKPKFKSARTKVFLVTLGIFGASLFYGDGVITPAISVLSAVEGLKVATPSLSELVLPIAVAVLTLLFVFQRYGTSVVGKVFGPIMVAWFTVLALAGIGEVAKYPAILRALSPTYAIAFFTEHGTVAFISLGSVVLAITGAEALYADMGHFGASPIRRAWFFLVFPALILNYLGQGGLILHSPAAVENPFYLMFPGWSRIPLVFLATIATVIASQAVISGAFSVSRQAFQLGVLPQLTIKHTSRQEAGQIYAPGINWGLFVAVLVVVLGFGSSAALASAYGVAVTATFIINSILFLAVVRVLWHKPVWMIVLGGSGVLIVEVAFFAANVTKIPHGGWLPLAIAGAIFTVLMTWQRGRVIVTRNRTAREGSLREFVTKIHALDPPIHRVPGTAVFLNANVDTAPLALRATVDYNHILHEAVVIVSIEFARVPHIPEDRRLIIDDLGDPDDGITHVTAVFGFSDDPDVPRLLRSAAAEDLEIVIDHNDVSYFLSRMTIVRTDAPGMPRWQKRLFLTVAHNAANPVEYFGLPIERTVTMGGQVKL